MNGFVGWTSKEQSKKLLEAGLDPNTADMYYKDDEFFPRPIPYSPEELESYLEKLPFWRKYMELDTVRFPCWSLGRLINIIPSKIKNANLEIFTNTEEKKELLGVKNYEFSEVEVFKTENHIFYNIEYNPNQFRISDVGFTEDRLIDGVINMILYLLQEDIMKKVNVKQIFNINDLKEL